MKGLNVNCETQEQTTKIWSLIVQETMQNIDISEKKNLTTADFFSYGCQRKNVKRFPSPEDEILMLQCAFHLTLLNAFEQTSRFADSWRAKKKKRDQGLEEMCTIIVFTAYEKSWAVMACRHSGVSFFGFSTWLCLLSPELEFQQMRAATTDDRDTLRLVMENRCEVLGEDERGWITVKPPPLWSLFILQTDDQTLTSALSRVNINC